MGGKEEARDLDTMSLSTEDARQFYDVAFGQLNRQQESRSRIFGKVGVLLGFEAVVLAQLLVVFRGLDWQVSVVPLAALGVSWILLSCAYLITTWKGAPDIDKVVDGMDSGRSSAEMLMRAVRAIRTAYNLNERRETAITLLVNWSIVGLGVSLLTAVIIMLRNPALLGGFWCR